MYFKMSSAKWQQFCLGLNVLTKWMAEFQQLEQDKSWAIFYQCFVTFVSCVMSNTCPCNNRCVTRLTRCYSAHDDVMTWKLFPHYWLCVRRILSLSVIVVSPHKWPVMQSLGVFFAMYWKTFMIHQTFVQWALHIQCKFVKSLISDNLGLASDVSDDFHEHCLCWTIAIAINWRTIDWQVKLDGQFWTRWAIFYTFTLTPCGLVTMTPYGNMDLGQHWLR